MTNLISHPFRLSRNGGIATIDDSEDEYIAERIAIIIATRPGERPMVPLFGTDDPAFDELSLPALQVQMELFEIPAIIEDMDEEPLNDGLTNVSVSFSRPTVDELEDEDDEEDEIYDD